MIQTYSGHQYICYQPQGYQHPERKSLSLGSPHFLVIEYAVLLPSKIEFAPIIRITITYFLLSPKKCMVNFNGYLSIAKDEEVQCTLEQE